MKGLDVGIVPALFPYPWEYLHWTHYRESSIKPPGRRIFLKHFWGGGGGAYLIQIHGVRQKIILHLLVLAHRSTIYPSCNLKWQEFRQNPLSSSTSRNDNSIGKCPARSWSWELLVDRRNRGLFCMSMRDRWTSYVHGGSPQGFPSSKWRVSKLS